MNHKDNLAMTKDILIDALMLGLQASENKKRLDLVAKNDAFLLRVEATIPPMNLKLKVAKDIFRCLRRSRKTIRSCFLTVRELSHGPTSLKILGATFVQVLHVKHQVLHGKHRTSSFP